MYLDVLDDDIMMKTECIQHLAGLAVRLVHFLL